MDELIGIVNGDCISLSGAVPAPNLGEGSCPQQLMVMEEASPSSLPEGVDLAATPDSIDTVRSVFLAAKTNAEVHFAAKCMSVQTWLDYAIKLSPKQVKLDGKIDARVLSAELGPIRPGPGQ